MENQLVEYTKHEIKQDKKEKSLNRRFGLLLIIAILLAIILILEIVFQFIG